MENIETHLRSFLMVSQYSYEETSLSKNKWRKAKSISYKKFQNDLFTIEIAYVINFKIK